MTVAVHVFPTMGTTVSIRFPGQGPAAQVLRAVEEEFDAFDRRFSLYRPDSEISRIAHGELALQESTRILRDSYTDALDWRRRTHGAFTPHRPDGVIDLSGIVKAQAIAAAGDILNAAGQWAWLINAGGDLLASGAFHDTPWRLGIVDPDRRDALLCTVAMTGTRRALATSGTAERGEHIWRATGSSSGAYRQVSVLADDVTTADVLATALLAGGPESCDDLLNRFDVDVVTVDGHGELTATPGFRSALGIGAQ